VSAAQLQEAVSLIEGVLTGHDDVASGARARLSDITERGFNISTNAYITLKDGDASNDVRATLLHGIFAALEQAGIGLAFPAPPVVLPAAVQ